MCAALHFCLFFSLHYIITAVVQKLFFWSVKHLLHSDAVCEGWSGVPWHLEQDAKSKQCILSTSNVASLLWALLRVGIIHMLEQENYLPLTKLSYKQVWSVYQVINTRGERRCRTRGNFWQIREKIGENWQIIKTAVNFIEVLSHATHCTAQTWLCLKCFNCWWPLYYLGSIQVEYW